MTENKKMVMIPGPTPVADSIRTEMGREIMAFGDPRFVRDYKILIDDLGELLHCSGKTFVIAGTGTLAMEMAVSNITKKGDRVLVVSHGYFGDRFLEICNKKGLETDVLSAAWGRCVPLEEIEKRLQETSYAAVIISHVDTSTGVVADLRAIGEMKKKFPDTLLVVDGVCATGAVEEDVDAMGIDILFTGSQKAFGVCPGMLVLWASQKALDKRKALGSIPEYYVDFEKWLPIMENPAKYFATPAINLVWAMKEAVHIIQEEGLHNRCDRHQKTASAVQFALEKMGFGILAQEDCRAATLSNVVYPAGIDDAAFRNLLWEEGMIVAGGLGAYAGKLFRLGHMGNIDTNDLVAALSMIERALVQSGVPLQFGTGVGAFLEKKNETVA